MTQTAQRTCKHVGAGQVCPFEAEHQRRDEIEAKFEAEESNRLYSAPATEVTQTEQRYGLYCGQCGHGNGCEHGVPVARW